MTKWTKDEPNKNGWWLVYYVKRKVMMVGLFKKGEDGGMYICNEDYEPELPINKLLHTQEVLFKGPVASP